MAQWVAAALVGAAFVPGPAQATQPTPVPAAWPATAGASPQLEGWPHALRLSGSTRAQTGLAGALTLRGTGGYPYTTPDRSEGWWGLASCPRSIIVVAADSPADALAASALSDPTGNSTEPYLQITASPAQSFDTPGDWVWVDTDFAPILVTRSGRQGGVNLDIATRLAAQDLRSGGCTTARTAIVVGGTSAVPAGVDAELLSIGYERIFRIAGATRYETARLIAQALGTAATTATACSDPLVNDGNARMAFYANATLEYREAADRCRLLTRTVVLADGIVGADALAAGWWTSFWQVPVLLHDGSATLPLATRTALQTLTVDHVVVLGGTSRIDATVAAQAAAAASGAEVVRVAGADRYATSVEMARRFGGWYTLGRGTEFAGSLVCIAASSGGSATSVGQGWADALAAGPWCARANGAAANPQAPRRALTPTTGTSPTTSAVGTPSTRPNHDAVPVLLVRAGASALPPSVRDLLAEAFHPAADWCTSVANGAGCLAPGFAVVFGGASVVPDSAVSEVSRLLSGGRTLGDTHLQPRLDSVVLTRLNMAPVYADVTNTALGGGAERLCVARGGYRNARWLVVDGVTSTTSATGRVDVMMERRYLVDGDGTARTPEVGAPVCLPVVVPAAATSLAVRAVGLSGRSTSPGAATTVNPATSGRLSLTGAVSASGPQGSGTASESNVSGGGVTVWSASGNPSQLSVVSRSQSVTVTSASTVITLTRGIDNATATGPDTFTATFTLETPLGAVVGTASGEALLAGGVWRLRGVSVFGAGTWNVNAGAGGFTADITVNGAGFDDDVISWRVDGVVS
jgi:hypothetical protein